MKKLITALFILLFPLQTFAAFAYSLPITIQHGQVANTVTENYTKFPIDVDITQSTLKTIGNGGHVQNSNGYDIYFYSDSGCTTRLPAERELYNASTGRYTGWVQMAVSTTSDKIIYACYGDSGISTDPNSDGTYGATSTWDSNYKGVWHLPNGTTLTANDSTGNANNGTALVGATATSSGQIDGAVAFSGVSNGTISVPASASLNPSTLTFSTWLKYTGSSFNGGRLISSKTSYSGSSGWELDAQQYGNIELIGSSGAAVSDTCVSNWTTTNQNIWYYIVATVNGTTGTIYCNAVNKGSGSIATITTTGQKTYLGSENNSADWLAGALDEARVSNIIRSADWIKTEYNNQSATSTFYTIGSENPLGGGVTTTYPIARMIINLGQFIINSLFIIN